MPHPEASGAKNAINPVCPSVLRHILTHSAFSRNKPPADTAEAKAPGPPKQAPKKERPLQPESKQEPSKPGFLFSRVCNYWRKIESTTKRLEKGNLLVTLLLHIYFTYPEDLVPAVLLTINQIREPWSAEPSVLNFAESNLKKVLFASFGTDNASLKSQLDKLGDLGCVAESLKKRQAYIFVKPKPMTLQHVFSAFLRIADTSGDQAAKGHIISDILFNGSPVECRYIVRFVLGKFRLGMQKKSVITGVADFLTGILLHDRAGSGRPVAENVAEPFLRRCMENILDNGKLTLVSAAESEHFLRAHAAGQRPGASSLSDASSDASLSEETADDVSSSDGSEPVQKQTTVIETPSNDKAALNAVSGLRQRCHILVNDAYKFCPSLESLILLIAREQDMLNILPRLQSVTIVPSIPVLPMLARPTNGPEEIFTILESVNDFACDFKYDGFRAQIHYDHGANVRQMFSRSLENMSARFPEVIASAIEAFEGASAPLDNTSGFVIDGEICAVDVEKSVILPFQYVSRRLRDASSQGASADAKNPAPIVLFVFDLLYLNGKSLLDTDLRARRSLLAQHFHARPNRVEFARAFSCDKTTDLRDLLGQAIDARTEGLIVKILDGPGSHYQPDERSQSWLKLKKDYIDALGDSFDLVPVAAWNGKGKRTGVLGAYLLAAYNSASERWETITQLGTGFSDADLRTFTDFFMSSGRALRKKPSDIFANLREEPDFWFAPEDSQVWEVRCANISLSPTHTVAWSVFEGDKGIALRLPRLIRVRDDKTFSSSTGTDQLIDAFRSQPDRCDADDMRRDE